MVAAVAMTAGIDAMADDRETDLDLLVTWMTGSFSSAVQAAEDPEYFDISLHMTPIWTDREDGRWLYVEQAVAEYADRPYRQRVYRVLEIAEGLFESQVYTLPDPAAVVGAWSSEQPLIDLTPDDLEERDGCSILMRRRDQGFVGSTLASLCTSTLRGASYATSEVLITADGMISWDRGFADDGRQVWGAAKGGYVFDRIVDDPPEATSESESGSESESEAGPLADDSSSGSGSGSELIDSYDPAVELGSGT
jgi:hypothetical protein